MTAQTEPQEFFSLGAKYNIDPDAAINDLDNDASCLLSVAGSILSHVAFELGEGEGNLAENPQEASQLVYAAWYLTQMARNVGNTSHSRRLMAKIA